MMLLTVMSIVCCAISISNAANLSKFAFNAEPRAFQQAAHWYYTRFYTAAVSKASSTLYSCTDAFRLKKFQVFWTIQAALSAVVFLATLLRTRPINFMSIRFGKIAF